MKRLLTLLLCAVLLVPAFSAAEEVPAPGASGPAPFTPLTGSDLIALREEVIAALQSVRGEDPVLIPSGDWVVGEDIPAGSWSFRDPGGKFRLSTTLKFSLRIAHSLREEDFNVSSDVEVGRVDLEEGTVIRLDQSLYMAPVSFASVIPQEKAAPRDYPAFSAASRSADDLIRLQYDLLRMIVLTPDCKEVLLPAGVWTVGEDIPAGTWSLRAGNTGCSVRYYKDTVTYNRNVYLLAPKSSPVTLDLKEGWQLYLYRPVYFAPVRPGE